jgi:hypothetical protein
MEWLNNELYDGYRLIGDISGPVVRLFIRHPFGDKLLVVKHMPQSDLDNANLEDIRQHFSRHIHKMKSKTLSQVKLQCT